MKTELKMTLKEADRYVLMKRIESQKITLIDIIASTKEAYSSGQPQHPRHRPRSLLR